MYLIIYVNAVIKSNSMFREYVASQAALMMVICNYMLDEESRMSEGEIKTMLFDLMDMIE